MQVVVLATHDEAYGLVSTLHADEDAAYEQLRKVFLTGEYDREVTVPEDATREQIEEALNRLPLFSWDVTSGRVPGLPEPTVTTEWGFRHPGFPHAGVGPHVQTSYTGHDGWSTGPYTESDARYFAQGKPVVRRTTTTYPPIHTEWEEVP